MLSNVKVEVGYPGAFPLKSADSGSTNVSKAVLSVSWASWLMD